MAHIPPGDSECLEGWSRNYYKVVNRFADTIKAQFFGHVHTDGFIVFYEDMNNFRSKPTNVLYTAPSVTTFENLNPAYRMYTIDGNYNGSSYEVYDFETYFLNLTETLDTDQLQWKLLNSFCVQGWHNLSEQIRTNETMFETFLENHTRNNNYQCDDSCHKEILCSMRRGHHNETALCPTN
uniref:Sphingomyelin phosphodiesterase n=1 Tax=Ditylenchus dipsaci TaxID=166011 RepID=A0A915DF07_9BILA